jgi:hypothetical protein
MEKTMDDLIKRVRITQADCPDTLALADALEAAAPRLTALESERDHLIATQAACDGGSCEHDGCQRKDLTGYRETAAKWVAEFHAMKKRIYDLESERATLLHEVEIHARDAERYRWLRDNTTDEIPYRGWWQIAGSAGADKSRLDAAIDAAMANQKQAG